MLCTFLGHFMHVWLHTQMHTHVKQLCSSACELLQAVKSSVCCWLELCFLSLPKAQDVCRRPGSAMEGSNVNLYQLRRIDSVTHCHLEQRKNVEGREGTRACFLICPEIRQPQPCWWWDPYPIGTTLLLPGLRSRGKVSRRQKQCCLCKCCESSTPWDFASPLGMWLTADALYVFAFYFSWFLIVSLTTACLVMLEDTWAHAADRGILLLN